MTKTFNVNFITKTIEVSSSFAKKAGIYGSAEYLMLTDAQKTHPDYKLDFQKPKNLQLKVLIMTSCATISWLQSMSNPNL